MASFRQPEADTLSTLRLSNRVRLRSVMVALTLARLPHREAGMATAEYAVATVAACAFAGVLVTIVRSEQVRTLLVDVITSALQA